MHKWRKNWWCQYAPLKYSLLETITCICDKYMRLSYWKMRNSWWRPTLGYKLRTLKSTRCKWATWREGKNTNHMASKTSKPKMGNTAMNFFLVSVCFHKNHLSETNRLNQFNQIISERKVWRTLIEFDCARRLDL